jgi:apolipoprotein N-acyltransferase
VALIASDLPENLLPETKEGSLRLLRDYAAQVNALFGQNVQAVVIPEKVAVVLPDYLAETDHLFSDAATRIGAVVFIGLVRADANGLWNEARIYSPDGSPPRTYEKHHMLPPFESKFIVGTTRTLLSRPNGLWGVAICKDMDFPKLSRQYALDGIGLLLVPAWDFDLDGWWHGRMAVLRGVEDGFSIARAPRHGILTVTDDRGRVLAERATNSQPFTVLVARAPVLHESTLYSRWGNWFAWLCLILLFAIPFSIFRHHS